MTALGHHILLSNYIFVMFFFAVLLHPHVYHLRQKRKESEKRI